MPFKKVVFGGWNNCYKLFNDKIELIVTSDVGPRIIRLSSPNGENMFAEFKDQLGNVGGDEWMIYGGHRLWHSPEEKPRTYYPDNFPVDVQADENRIVAIQETEPTTGIQKQITIEVASSEPIAKVTHTLTNRNLWAVEFAPWALSVMAPGGFAVVPQPPYISHEEHLLPARQIVLWHYTNMADPRWMWGEKFIILRQDRSMTKPQKVGVCNKNGWLAYVNNDQVFVKKYEHVDGATYPDLGCSTEVFTNEAMLEVETLGPLAIVNPGESLTHVEIWGLFDLPDMEPSEGMIAERITPIASNLSF